MALEIYVSGDMAYMEAIMTGLGHIYDDGYMGQIFAMALLCNAVLSLARYISDPKKGFLTSFWQAIILYLIMFSSTTKIVLYKEHEGYRPIAGDFPIGVMAPAHYITLVGNKLAERFKDNIIAVDTGWSMSSNTAFLEHGLSPLSALLTIRNASVNGMFEKSDLLALPEDPGNASSGIEASMRTYYRDCVFKAMALAKFDKDAEKYVENFNAAINASDHFGALLIDEPWITEVSLDGTSSMRTCTHAHSDIHAALIARAKERTANALFPMVKDDSSKSREEYLEKLREAWVDMNPIDKPNSLYNLSANHLSQYTSRGACATAPALGEIAVQTCSAQYDAIMERRYSEASKSESFLEMLKPMMTFVEGFVYAVSPIMIILVLFSGSAGLKMMGKYFSALLWIVLIPLCNALIDVYLNVYFNKWLNVAFSGDSTGASLSSISSQESVWTDLESFVAFAGTVQAMAPALAMFIIFAGVHTLQGMGSALSSGAAISNGNLHANQAVAVKNGSHQNANDTAVVGTDQYGNVDPKKVIITSAARTDAGASNVTMSAGDSSAYQKVSTTQIGETGSSQMGSGSTSQKTFQGSKQYGRGFDVNTASVKDYSQSQAQTLAIADQFVTGAGLSETGAHETGQKIASAIGAGLKLSADGTWSFKNQDDSNKGGKDKKGAKEDKDNEEGFFDSFMAKVGINAGLQGDIKAALDSSNKYATTMTTDERLQQLLSETSQVVKQVNDRYALAAKDGETYNDTEGFTDAEVLVNSQVASYNRTKTHTDQAAISGGASFNSQATTGNYFAVAGQNAQATGLILSGTADEAFQSKYVKQQLIGDNNLSSEDIKGDKQWQNIFKQLEEGNLKSLTNSDWNAVNEVIGDDAQLDRIGVTRNEDGSWNFLSGQEFAAKRMGTDVTGYKEAVNRLGNEDKSTRGERSDFLHRYAKSFDEYLANFTSDNTREAFKATGAALYDMSGSAGNLVAGVEKGGNHNAMEGFASQYEHLADLAYRVDSNVQDIQKKDDFFDKLFNQGRSAPDSEPNIKPTGVDPKTMTQKENQVVAKGDAVQIEAGKRISNALGTVPKPEHLRSDIEELWTTAQKSFEPFKAKIENRVADEKQDHFDRIKATGPLADLILNDLFDVGTTNEDRMEIQNPTNIAKAAQVYDSYVERSEAIGQLLKNNPELSDASHATLKNFFKTGQLDQPNIDQLKSDLGSDKVDALVKENTEFRSDLNELSEDGNVHAQRAFTMMMNDSKFRDAYSNYESSNDRSHLQVFKDDMEHRNAVPTQGDLADALNSEVVDHNDLANGILLRKMGMDFDNSLSDFKGITNLKGFGGRDDVIEYITGDSSDLDAAVNAFKGKEIYNDKESLTTKLETARSIYSDMQGFEKSLMEKGDTDLAVTQKIAHEITDEQMMNVLKEPEKRFIGIRDSNGDDGEGLALSHTTGGQLAPTTVASQAYEQNRAIFRKYGIENVTDDMVDEILQNKLFSAADEATQQVKKLHGYGPYSSSTENSGIEDKGSQTYPLSSRY